jgi:hypothetical protein
MQMTFSGDLIFTRILDQEVIVINSQHIAQALLEKRSRVYSDRPYLATVVPCVPLILFCTSNMSLKGTQVWLVIQHGICRL